MDCPKGRRGSRPVVTSRPHAGRIHFPAPSGSLLAVAQRPQLLSTGLCIVQLPAPPPPPPPQLSQGEGSETPALGSRPASSYLTLTKARAGEGKTTGASAFWNLVPEVTSSPLSCVFFVRSKSRGPSHTQRGRVQRGVDVTTRRQGSSGAPKGTVWVLAEFQVLG